MMKKYIVERMIFAVLLLSAGLASCSMKQDIYIEKSGSGRVTFNIKLANYVTEVVKQILTIFETEETIPSNEKSFFDIPAIEKDFHSRDGINLIALESPQEEELAGEFTFTDINRLLQETPEGIHHHKIIQLTQHEDANEITVRISRETIEALLKTNPSLNNPLVENFGPSATEGLTEEEYLEMMEFALGEESRLGIKTSSLVLNIHVEGRIIDQYGGRITDNNTVSYNIPLLPILMLQKSLIYSLKYQ